MVDALEIGYAIKDRRAELGMTQAQLAEASGVSKRCLWSLGREKHQEQDRRRTRSPGAGVGADRREPLR